MSELSTLHDGVLTRLRQMILEGDLPPGAPVRERALCEQLQVSRTPLREALKVLASERLVELLPNRGARVIGLTESDVRSMFEVMEGLEAMAGRLACVRASDADIAEIQALHWQMHAHFLRKELPEYFRLNQQIHMRIVQATGNPVLIVLYDGLGSRIRGARYLANRWNPERWQHAMDEHGVILEALTRRDGERLATILTAHLQGKCAAVLDHLQHGEPGVSAPVRAARRKTADAA